MSIENQELNKVDVKYNVDAAPIFSHAKPCINVSTTGQGLNKKVIRNDGDSLEEIWIKEFNVGQTSNPREKKTSRGRPRKFIQGESLTTGNINQVYSGKKTWKRIAVKKETSADKAVAGLDIGEKRKSVDLGGKEDHSVEGEKRKKIEVCHTTPMAEVAQQSR